MASSIRRNSAVAGVAILGFIALLIVFVGLAGDDSIDPGIVGQQAPQVVGLSLDGEFFDSAEVDGFLVVNFFATWCVGCIVEHPELVKTEAWGADNNVEIVAAVFDGDDPVAVANFFAENGGGWPVLNDPAVSNNYAVGRIPETFVVGPNGIVLERFQGEVTLEDIQGAVAAYEA